jgi:hypothetical protein
VVQISTHQKDEPIELIPYNLKHQKNEAQMVGPETEGEITFFK